MADRKNASTGAARPSPSANGRPAKLPLSPEHLADLRKSGLDDATILACGFRTEKSPLRQRKLLNWSGSKSNLGFCLVIPYFDATGKRVPFCRLKPDNPRKKKEAGKEKVFKYESPLGGGSRIYFPPGIAQTTALTYPSLPLFITEGEKKAAAAVQLGIPCIGIGGVDSWSRRREPDADGDLPRVRELLDELAAIPWQGRLVYIVFDSDAARKKDVRRAERALAKALSKLGATVRIVRLPEGPADKDGVPAKVGLDDYLVANGASAFRQLTQQAIEPENPEADAANEAVNDPDRLARLFLKMHGRDEDGELMLRYWRGEWHWSNGRLYRLTPDDELRPNVHQAVKDEFDYLNRKALANWTPKSEGEKKPEALKVTRTIVLDTISAMQSYAVTTGDLEQPFWIADDGSQQRKLIAMENGLLHVEALLAGKKNVLLPHSPRWFSATALPYVFDPAATCPLWLTFLARNLEGDGERIAMLQEWFGYCLLPDSTLHKFLVLEGDGANGKSVACAVLRAALGVANCSSVPLELFGARFQLAQTLGKLANVSAEVGELDKAAEGFLKSFTSGDPMLFERKFKDPISAVPSARLVLATNNRPRFSDKTEGIWRRMILMPFRVSIPAKDRIKGMDRPEWWQENGQLPGIFVWAIAGLARLRRECDFTFSKVCDKALNDYRAENNPARQFLIQHFEEAPDGMIETATVYGEYRSWCGQNGYHQLSDRSFGKELKRTFSKVIPRFRGPRGDRRWYYVGLQNGCSLEPEEE